MTDEADPLAVRRAKIAERQARVAPQLPGRRSVRIEPRDDDVRKYIKHPHGLGFPKQGSVEWPLDRFTRRRIADGSVKLVEQQQQQQHHGSAHVRRSHGPVSE